MKEKSILLMNTLLIVFSPLIFSVFSQSLQEDSLALIDLYDNTNGLSWTNTANWKTTQPLSSWTGVSITNNRVTILNLINKNLVGTLPTSLGNLTQLTALILINNQLSGSIPESIGNLIELEKLFLQKNSLTGPLPNSIGNLSKLIVINIAFNQLQGSIPEQIGTLNQLTILNLQNNEISGSIPSSIHNLTNCERMYLSSNKLQGAIPKELGLMQNLTTIYLNNNQLSDTIPSEFGAISSCTELYLGHNQLTGSIPPSLQNLTQLTHLDLSANHLTGPIPSELGNILSLQRLQLSLNNLTGSVPETFTTLSNVVSIILSDNKLEDIVNLTSLEQLNILNVKKNKFTFEDLEQNIPIPNFYYAPQDSIHSAQFFTLVEGEPLTLNISVGGSANHYQWVKNDVDIPGATEETFVIPSVSMADTGTYLNKITNTIATDLVLYRRPTHVSVIPLSVYQDSLALLALFDSTNGENWIDHSNWKTEQPLSTWYGITVENGRVKAIDLTHNNLTGCIPSTIGSFTEIKEINMDSNMITGHLPVEIIQCTSLVHLDIACNQLTGPISNGIAMLLKLQSIDISHNAFTILPDLSSIQTLDSLSIHNNQLQFADIEPNIEIPYFIYAPQDSIEVSESGEWESGSTISLSCDVSGSANLYQWVKNDIEIPGATNNPHIISSIQPSDSGAYTCIIKNTVATELALFRRPIHVSVTPMQLYYDSLALVALFDSTNGKKWKRNDNWCTSSPLKSWYGILVYDNQVTGLFLSSNNLVGSIPSSIGILKAIKYLDLSRNKLTHSIPPSFGSCISLILLKLDRNQLEDTIPETIGNLAELRILNLARNQLTGSVPESFKNFKKIRHMNLSSNSLSDFPDLSSLKTFSSLQIQNNKLTFEDIEPNITLLPIKRKYRPKFIYYPQDSVGCKKDTIIPLGQSAVFSVSVGGSANIYQWFKNGIAIPGAIDSIIALNAVAPNSSGYYVCKITNTLVPQLTLFHRPIKLSVKLPVIKEDDNKKHPKKNGAFAFFPNPVRKQDTNLSFTLPRNTHGAASLLIYNAFGKVVYSQNFSINGSYHRKGDNLDTRKIPLTAFFRSPLIIKGTYAAILTIKGKHGKQRYRTMVAVKK